MITSTDEIQKIIAGMERQITTNTEHIDVLSVFRSVALQFNSKVFNKRFTDEINANLPMLYSSCYCKFNQYGNSYEFVVYQRERISDNYCKYFTFKLAECFIETDSGKHRVNADAFSDRCQQIREEIIAENIRIREDIDKVWQILKDARELEQKYKEFDSKYSYSLKDKFKCNYRLH